MEFLKSLFAFLARTGRPFEDTAEEREERRLRKPLGRPMTALPKPLRPEVPARRTSRAG